jgi:MinD-like ATPase involved in chromosome partitioning or flagellar assembly
VTTGLLTAGSGHAWETELVAALDRPGSPMTVVRRCADIGDVLAVATTGLASVAVLSADLRRLDTEAVARLHLSGMAIVCVHPAADERARLRLERLGVNGLVPDDAGPDAVVAVVRAAAIAVAEKGTEPGPHRQLSDPRRSLPPISPDVGVSTPEHPSDPGQVIAVWGPTGAPGRSTVAAGLAVEAAAAGNSTLLIDADVFGGVVATAFGLLDESPGLAGACRAAANGRLDAAALRALCWSLEPRLRLLTGIARADRWPEVRPSALPAVLGVARDMASVVIVDCAFGIEADEEISFDVMAPRRNGATLAVLADADAVLAVGSCDPPGMERLIRGLDDLAAVLPSVDPRVVLNRCRPSAASGEESVQAVERFTGRSVTVVLPEDRGATDRAWRRGVSLAEAAPNSALRAGLKRLARVVLAQPAVRA